MEESIITSSVTEVYVNENKKKKSSFWNIFNPWNWINKVNNKIEKIQQQLLKGKAKKLKAEITKLEAGKLKDFWNKFWLIISCGCYNNHGKVERKIKEKTKELAEVKKQLAKFNVVVDNENNDNEPQPSTSSAITDDSKTWSDKTKAIIENTSLLKQIKQNSTSSKL